MTLWLKWLLIGLAGGLVLGLLLARGRPVDPVVMHRIDTVLVAGPEAAQLRDSVTRVVAQAGRDAKASKRHADRLKLVADSLRALPLTVDTVIAYDTLSAAYDKLSDAYSQQGHALALLMVQADRDSARIGSLERVLGEARAELVKTRKPSRWGLGCAGGYGASLMGGVVHASPALACGVSFRLR